MHARSQWLVLSLFALFPGCASDDGMGSASAGYNAEELDQRSDAVKYCGGGKYVEGVDVSHWQGASIDWKKVKASGREFAFMKATEGTNYKDDTFAKNWAGAKAAGLIRGAYHFHRTNADPIKQAEYFVSAVGKLGADDFPLMLDVEDANNPPSAAAVKANVKACLEHIQKLTGRVPIIYTGSWYWSGYLANAAGFEKYPLWIAAYPNSWPNNSYCPSLPANWKKWTFWQYSSGANGVPAVPGIGQSCDRNRFDGTLADLKAFVGASAGTFYQATYVEQSWPLASQPPVQMKVGETKTGYIKLKNTGTSTWKAGKVLLAPIPRDQASPLQAGSWVSSTRVSSVKNDVAPGAVGTFAWDIKPSKAGDFSPYFAMVAEGVTWFADAPKGGGPPDKTIQIKLHVTAASGGSGGAGGTGGAGKAGSGGSTTAGSGGSTTAGSGGNTTAGSGGEGEEAGAGGEGEEGGTSGEGGGDFGGFGGEDSGGSGGEGEIGGAASGVGGGSGKGGSGEAGAAGTEDSEMVVLESANSNGDDGGCGCRTVSHSERSAGGLASFGVLLLGVLRRRRRRS